MSAPSQDQEGGEFYLSDLSPSDKPWDAHRASAEQVQGLYDTSEFSDYFRRIRECSRQLEFAFKANDDGELKLRLQRAHFCRLRWCPVCQWRRSLMWRARFFQVIPEIVKDYPTARFVFLTLTVKNCLPDELRETLTWMNKSWERLTKRKLFPAIGWVKAVEVTRKSSDGTAHPHFHCLLMVSSGYFGGTRYINQAQWTEMWKSCLRVDYTPIVNVKAVKPKKGADSTTAIPIAICETLKYSVKEGDLIADQEWLHELTRQLHKTRAIAVGGVFKSYLSEDEPEDLINTDLEDDEPTSEDDPRVTFGWREMVKRYQKQ